MNKKVTAYPIRKVISIDKEKYLDVGLRLRYINNNNTNDSGFVDVFGGNKLKIVKDNTSIPSDKGYSLEIDTSNGSVLSSIPLKEINTDHPKHFIQVGPMDKNGLCPVMCGSTLLNGKCMSFTCPINKQIMFSHVFNYLFGKDIENREDYQMIISQFNAALVGVPAFTPDNFFYVLGKLKLIFPEIPEVPRNLTIAEVMIMMPPSLTQQDLLDFVLDTQDEAILSKKCKYPKALVDRLINTSILRILPIFVPTDVIDKYVNYLLSAK